MFPGSCNMNVQKGRGFVYLFTTLKILKGRLIRESKSRLLASNTALKKRQFL